MAFNSDYIDVAARLREFKEKHPEGSLQTVSIEFKEIGGQTIVLYTAAAYRSPDDERPGIAMASEPFPGKTNFTRDSEVMNAETSAWGRAILAADTIIVLKRDRLSKDATLSITSREMEEAEHHLNFSENAVWTIGDRPATPQTPPGGTTGAIVTNLLMEHPKGLTRAEIAAKAFISVDSASGAIRRLKDQGTILEVIPGRFALRTSEEEIF